MSAYLSEIFNTLKQKNLVSADASERAFQETYYNNPEARKNLYKNLVSDGLIKDTNKYTEDVFLGAIDNTSLKPYNFGSDDDMSKVWYESLGTFLFDNFVKAGERELGAEMDISKEARENIDKRNLERTFTAIASFENMPDKTKQMLKEASYKLREGNLAQGIMFDPESREANKQEVEELKELQHQNFADMANTRAKTLQPYIDAGYIDKNNQNEFIISQIGSMAQNIPFLVAGAAFGGTPILGKAIEIVGRTAFIALEATELAGETYGYSAKKDENGMVIPGTGSLTDAGTGYAFGVLSGWIEFMGVEKAIFRGLKSKDAVDAFGKYLGKTYLKATVGEGAEEAIQSSISQLTKMGLGQQKEYSAKEAGQAALHGLFAGAVLGGATIPISAANTSKMYSDITTNMSKEVDKLEKSEVITKEQANKYRTDIEIIKNTKEEDFIETVNTINETLMSTKKKFVDSTLEEIKATPKYKRILAEEDNNEAKALVKFYEEIGVRKQITDASESIDRIHKVVSNDNMTYEQKLAEGLTTEVIDKFKTTIEATDLFIQIQSSIKEGTVEQKKAVTHEAIMKNNTQLYLNIAFNTLLPETSSYQFLAEEIEVTTEQEANNLKRASGVQVGLNSKYEPIVIALSEPLEETSKQKPTDTMAKEETSSVEAVEGLETKTESPIQQGVQDAEQMQGQGRKEEVNNRISSLQSELSKMDQELVADAGKFVNDPFLDRDNISDEMLIAVDKLQEIETLKLGMSSQEDIDFEEADKRSNYFENIVRTSEKEITNVAERSAFLADLYKSLSPTDKLAYNNAIDSINEEAKDHDAKIEDVDQPQEIPGHSINGFRRYIKHNQENYDATGLAKILGKVADYNFKYKIPKDYRYYVKSEVTPFGRYTITLHKGEGKGLSNPIIESELDAQEADNQLEVRKQLLGFLTQFGFEINEAENLLINLPSKKIDLNIENLEDVAKALSSPLSEMLSYSKYFYEVEKATRTSTKFKKIYNKLEKEYPKTTKRNLSRLAVKEIFKELLEQKFSEKLSNEANIKKSLLDRIKQYVREMISYFQGVDWDLADRNVEKIVENTFKGEDFIRLTKKDGYKKVDFQQAFNENEIAKDIMTNIGTNEGITLTGSIAYATQGTVYRKIETVVHDLDFVNDKYTIEELDNLVKSFYPNAIKAYSFVEKYIVDTYLIPPKGIKIENIVRRDTGKIISYDLINESNEKVGSYLLTYEVSGTGKTIYEEEFKTGVEAMLVDFFSNDTSKRKIIKYDFEGSDGKNYQVNLSEFSSPFEAKLIYSRFKDIWDYNRFVPNRDLSDLLFEEANTIEDLKGRFPSVSFVSKSDLNGKLSSTKRIKGVPKVSVAIDVTKEDFNSFINGTDSNSKQSQQKVIIQDSVNSRSPFLTQQEVNSLNGISNEDIPLFLIFYQQSHINNMDLDNYPRLRDGSFDFLNMEAIKLEARAIKDAVHKLNSYKAGNSLVNIIEATSTSPFFAALTENTVLAKQLGSIKKDYPVNFNGILYNDLASAYETEKSNYHDKQVLIEELVELRLRDSQFLLDYLINKNLFNQLELMWTSPNADYDLVDAVQKAFNKLLAERKLQEGTKELSNKIRLLTSGNEITVDYDSKTSGRRVRTLRNVRMSSDNSQFRAEQKEGKDWVEKTFSTNRLYTVGETSFVEPKQTIAKETKVSPQGSMKATKPITKAEEDLAKSNTIGEYVGKVIGNPEFFDSPANEFVSWTLEQAKDVRVVFVDNNFVFSNGQSFKDKKGAYYHVDNTIYVNTSHATDLKSIYGTLGHESTHYLTSRALDDKYGNPNFNRIFRRDIERIYVNAMEDMKADTEFWDANQKDIKKINYDKTLTGDQLRTAKTRAIKEFVAYVMTNTTPSVTNWLQTNEVRKAKGQTHYSRFVDRVKEYFRTLFKNKPITYYNALEYVFAKEFNYKVNYKDVMKERIKNFEVVKTNEAEDLMSSFKEDNLTAINIRNVANMIKGEKDLGNWHQFITSLTYEQFFGRLLKSEEFLKSSEVYFDEKYFTSKEDSILEGKLSTLEQMKQYYQKETALNEFRNKIATKFYNYANSLEKVPVKRLKLSVKSKKATANDKKQFEVLNKGAVIEDLPETYLNKDYQMTSSFKEKIVLSQYLDVLEKLFGTKFELVHFDDVQYKYYYMDKGVQRYSKTVWKSMSKTDFALGDVRTQFYADELRKLGYIYLPPFADKNTIVGLRPVGMKLEDIDFSAVGEFYENKMRDFAQYALENGVMSKADIDMWIQPAIDYGEVNFPSYLMHLISKDLGLGATVENGTINNIIFNPEALETFGKDTFNAISIMKRAVQVLPLKQIMKEKTEQRKAFDSLSEKEKVGINFSNEKGLTFNAVIINSNTPQILNENGELVDATFSFEFRGKTMTVPIKDLLVNQFGTEEFDGANIHTGGWGKVVRKLAGSLKPGVIKGKMLNSYGNSPFYNKGAWFKTNSRILSQWMEENNIGLLIFDSAAKINTNPKSSILGENNVVEMSFEDYYHDIEKDVASDRSTGLAQSLTSFFNHSSNSTFASYSPEIIDRIINTLVNNFNETMYSLDATKVLADIRKSTFESRSNQQNVLANAIVDWVYTIAGTKAQQELTDEYVSKVIGNVFLEPSISSLLKDYVRKELKNITKARIPSSWMTLRPDFGWLEPNVIDTVFDNIKKGIREEIKRDLNNLLAKSVSLEQAIAKINNEEKKKDLEEKLKKNNKIIDDLNETYTSNTQLDELAWEEVADIIDTRTGKLKDGWSYISRDINNLNKFDVKFGDNVIATIVPGSDISSQSAPRVAGFIDEVDKGVVTLNSGYVQTVGGRDFDIDQLLITPYSRDYFTKSGYKEFTKAINKSKDNFIEKMVKEYRNILGDEQLLKLIGEEASTDKETLDIQFKKAAFTEQAHKLYMQAVTESGQKGQKVYNPLNQSLPLSNKFTKEVGQVLNDNKIFTAQAQMGFRSKVILNGQVYDLDPRKGISDFPIIASRLLHDNVDKPTNTNAFFYEMDLYTKFGIIYGVKDEIGEIDSSQRDAINSVFAVVQKINSGIFKYGVKLSSDNNLQTFGDERTLSDDLDYVNIQQRINQWIRSGNKQGLIEFLDISPQDRAVAEFYIDNMEVDSFEDSYSMNIVDKVNLSAIPNLFVSLAEYTKWQNDTVLAYLKDENYKGYLRTAITKYPELYKDFMSQTNIVFNGIDTPISTQENRVLFSQFMATLFTGNYELHKLKAQLIALVNPVIQSRFNTTYQGKTSKDFQNKEYEYVFDLANDYAYPRLMADLLTKKAIKFKDSDLAKEGIDLIVGENKFITMKSDEMGNLVYQVEVNGKNYTYDGNELLDETTKIGMRIRDLLISQNSIFVSDTFKDVNVLYKGSEKIFDPASWNRFQLNRLLTFKNNTNTDARISSALELLNQELGKYSEIEKEVFWKSLVGYPQGTLAYPLNLIDQNVDKFKEETFPSQSVLLELATKVIDGSGKKFVKEYVRTTPKTFPGMGFDKSIRMKTQIADQGYVDDDLLFEDVDGYEEATRDIKKVNPTVESEATAVVNQFKTIHGIWLNNNTPDITSDGVISWTIDPLANKLVPITKKNVSDWSKATPSTVERDAVSLEMLAGTKYSMFKSRLNSFITRHDNLTSIIQLSVNAIHDTLKTGKLENRKTKAQITSEINLLSENLGYQILDIKSPSLGEYSYLVDGVVYDSVESLLDAQGINDALSREYHKAAIAIRVIYDWESIKLAESMVTYTQFISSSFSGKGFGNQIMLDGYKTTWLNRLKQFTRMKGTYIPHTFKPEVGEELARTNAAYDYIMHKAQKENRKITREEALLEANNIKHDERFAKEIDSFQKPLRASGGKLHNWDLHRTLHDFIVGEQYIHDTMEIHDNHKIQLMNAVMTDFGVLESLIYEHNASMMGKSQKLKNEMKLWYALWSPSPYLRSTKMAINLKGKTKGLKQGDGIAFYHVDPETGIEKRIKFIIEDEDKDYFYASMNKEIYARDLQKYIDELENLKQKIEEQEEDYTDIAITEKHKRYLKSLEVSFTEDITLKESTDLILAELNKLIANPKNLGKYKKSDIYIKQYSGNTVVKPSGVEREFKSFEPISEKNRKKWFGKRADKAPKNMEEYLQAIQYYNSIISLGILPAPAVRNYLEANYKTATMIGIRRMIFPSVENDALKKILPKFLQKGERELVRRTHKFRVNFDKQVIDGNIKPLFDAMKQAYKAGDVEKMDLMFKSSDPNTLDKLKVLDALVAKYLFANGLGNITEIGATYVSDNDRKGAKANFMFQKAERINRINGAFLFGYKAMFIDGITNVKDIELAIEKGVARANGEYDKAYRELIEKNAGGRLGNMFAQFGVYRLNVIQRMIEQGKQEGQIKPVLSEIRKFHITTAIKNAKDNFTNIFKPKLKIGDKTFTSGSSVDQNIPRVLAKELALDLTVGEFFEFLYPGLRLGGPVNKLINKPLVLLVSYLLSGDEPDDYDIGDILFTALGLKFGMFFTMPLQFLWNLANEREGLIPFNPRVASITKNLFLPIIAAEVFGGESSARRQKQQAWYYTGELIKAFTSFDPTPRTRRYQSDLQNLITNTDPFTRTFTAPFKILDTVKKL